MSPNVSQASEILSNSEVDGRWIIVVLSIAAPMATYLFEDRIDK